jgi:hypothetical protein
MNPSAPIYLSVGQSSAQFLADEGGVLSSFSIAGFQVLARTPWAAKVSASAEPAPDEPTWVKRWRGGWQLCAPNTGQPVEGSSRPAFHGLASQASWQVLETSDQEVSFQWLDSDGLFRIRRTWTLHSEQQISVESELENLSAKQQAVGVAEHLILGSDFLGPIVAGDLARLEYCRESEVLELDYDGSPTGVKISSPSSLGDFTALSKNQPARVFALTNSTTSEILVRLGGFRATVNWSGLPHALIWQEFGVSEIAPWNNEVFALGIEPTNVPHGIGANNQSGPFLEANQVMKWKVALRIDKEEKVSIE